MIVTGLRPCSDVGEAVRTAKWLAIFLVLAGLAGCGHKHIHRRVRGDYTIQVSVDERINRDGPVEVDVVVVYDEELLKKWLELPAAEWFDKRAQSRRDSGEGVRFDLWGWEWVPGQRVDPIDLPRRHGALATLIFANYLDPGEHRVRVPPNESFHLILGRAELQALHSE